MQPQRRPFGTALRGMDVSWPPYTGPSLAVRRGQRPAELWERGPDTEAWIGEYALGDLEPDTTRSDVLMILARYLTVRVALHAGDTEPAAFLPAVERGTALEYLEAIRGNPPESRWLRAVLLASDGRVSRALVARLNAAAAAAARHGHVNGAFALRSAAYEIAAGRAWDAEAGRTARAIAAGAGQGGGRRSQKLWARRARVHERREHG